MNTKNNSTLAIAFAMLITCSCNKSPTKPGTPSDLGDNIDAVITVSITGPTAILIDGQQTQITGRIYDENGEALGNEGVGVEDGLGLFCTTFQTNEDGTFSYQTTVRTSTASIVVLIVRSERFSFIFQSATRVGDTYHTNSLAVAGISMTNASDRDLRVNWTTPENNDGSQRIPSDNGVLQAIRVVGNEISKRCTIIGGVSWSVGVYGGVSWSGTVDDHEVFTSTVQAGAAPYSFAFYTTNAGDLGGCWAPFGGILGFTPIEVSGDVTICVGTDGVSAGAEGDAGGFTGGFSCEIVNW